MVNARLISEVSGGVILRVKASPNAGKSSLIGVRDDYLYLKIASAPVKGKANKECQRLLAEFFGLKKSQVQIRHGGTAHHKEFILMGINKEEVLGRLKG